MQLDLQDLAYLVKVYEAIKSDNPPELTTICPECDETADPDDNVHVTLTTRIPGYWAERGDWGEPNTYGMNVGDSPKILIGCEGYHLIRF